MRVLLAYEGGAVGARAFRAIAGWAGGTAAEVHIVRVLNPNEIHDTHGPSVIHALTAGGSATGGETLYAQELPAVPTEDRSQAMDGVRTAAEEEMLAVARRHVGSYRISAHVVIDSEVADRVLALATEIDTDLIVVGSHGRKGISHMLLGSIAEAIVRRSPVPVLVVGPKVQ